MSKIEAILFYFLLFNIYSFFFQITVTMTTRKTCHASWKNPVYWVRVAFMCKVKVFADFLFTLVFILQFLTEDKSFYDDESENDDFDEYKDDNASNSYSAYKKRLLKEMENRHK